MYSQKTADRNSLGRRNINKEKKSIGPILIVVLAQLFGTSLWFTPNSVLPQIVEIWNLASYDIGILTNAVQLGFILGTLTFVAFGFSDKYDPSKVIFVCCVIGALANLYIIIETVNFQFIILSRFLVGFSLAGIYPIGMKLIITWSKYSSSTNLAVLVGMLTLGSALPHLVRLFGINFDWKLTIAVSSILACIGGIQILILGSGPYGQSKNKSLPLLQTIKQLIFNKDYISSALGYFGHMWELYAFWACVPILLLSTLENPSAEQVAGFSFLIIGIGGIGCFCAGFLSQKIGSPSIAAASLVMSALACLLYPLIPNYLASTKILLLIFWGFFVISDSPLYSSISAQAAPKEIVGTALVIQNCIGFSVSMISILICTYLFPAIQQKIAWILLPGPLVALLFFHKLIGKNY